MKLSELLQISRKSRKLTLMDLVNKTGISYSMLYRILNGGLEKPTPDILEKLSEPLHLDYHYLLQVAGYIEKLEIEKKSNALYKIPIINWDYCKHLFPFRDTIDAGFSDELYNIVQQPNNTFALIIDEERELFPIFQMNDLIVCQPQDSYDSQDIVIYWNANKKRMNFGVFNCYKSQFYIDDLDKKNAKTSVACTGPLQDIVVGKITHHHRAYQK
jgi:transcriptional regulator with XRE-family HTH domain